MLNENVHTHCAASCTTQTAKIYGNEWGSFGKPN